VLEITNVTQNLCKTSFRPRSMMNSLREIIANVLLVRLHCSRSIIVQRVKKRCIKINHQRMLVNSRKTIETSTRRTNPKTKVQGKERNPSCATIVVVLIILQRKRRCGCTHIDQYVIDIQAQYNSLTPTMAVVHTSINLIDTKVC
jgi:hypothetical protein